MAVATRGSLLALFGLLFSHVLGEEVSPIRKVITLIEDMKVQVEKDAASDLEAFDKYMCWCETNDKEKTSSIEKAENSIAELTSFVEESEAKAGELKTEISGLEEDISSDKESLASATGVREKENKAFLAAEADMKETLALLGQAYTVLSKAQLLQKKDARKAAAAVLLQVSDKVHGRFPQFRSVMQRDLFDVLDSLQTVAQHGRHQEGSALATGAFLGQVFLPKREATAFQQARLLPWEKTDEQIGAEAKPNELTGQAANSKSYNGRSGTILGMLAEMGDEFTRDLSAAQKEDFEAEVMFQKLRASKLGEITAATGQKDQKDGELAELSDATAKGKEDIVSTEQALSADETFLLNLKKSCKTEDEEYKKRSKVRSEELVAISETLKILTEDDARDLYDKTMSFMQVRAAHRAAALAAQDRASERAMQHLAQVARKHGDWALVSLAVRVRLDAFTKVKEVMDKMLANLAVQQQEEYAKWESCKKEIDTTEDLIKEGVNTKEDLDDKHKALTGTLAMLTSEIATLKEGVAEMEVSLKQAGEQRKAESTVFQTSISDQRATINILDKALTRLKAFYSFAEVGEHGRQAPPPKPSSAGYHKSAGAGGVIQLLMKIIEDAEIEEQDLEMGEQKAQTDYAGFVRDATASIEAGRAAISKKEGLSAETKSDKSETAEAQLANDAELAKLGDLLKAHHLDCDYVLKYFDMRQTARSEEMDAIKDAKAILAGAGLGK